MQAKTFQFAGDVYYDRLADVVYKVESFSFDPRNLDEMVTCHNMANPLVKFTLRRDWFERKYDKEL